jgi:hypothetical protein
MCRCCCRTGTGLSSVFDGDTNGGLWVVGGGKAGEGSLTSRKGNGQSVGEASFLCVSQASVQR